ncbi:MAG: hypothetical protein SNJ63_08270 [Sphingomonadaceae bacterium]
MARLRQLSSNELFDTLADWSLILQDTSLANPERRKPSRPAASIDADADDDHHDAANDDGGARKKPVNRITQRRQRL